MIPTAAVDTAGAEILEGGVWGAPKAATDFVRP